MVEKRKVYESTLHAIAEYNKKNMKRINLALNRKTEADIIERIESLDESVNGYIKRLIREDIQRS